MVHRASGSPGGRISRTPHAAGAAVAAPYEKVLHGAVVATLEVTKRLFCLAGFSKEVAEVVATDLRRFTECLLSGEVVLMPSVVYFSPL